MRLYEMSDENIISLLSEIGLDEKESAEKNIANLIKLQNDSTDPEDRKSLQQSIDYNLDILNDIDAKEIDEKIKKIADKVKNECGKFYNACKKVNKVLFRGIRNERPPVFVSTSIEGRRPKDSNEIATIKFDTFAEQLGIRALRSNSIFATTQKSQAKEYGYYLYNIFPKDTADFSWSMKYSDIVLVPYMLDSCTSIQLFQQKFMLDQLSLDKALLSGHEILIHGRYIAIIDDIYNEMVSKKLL